MTALERISLIATASQRFPELGAFANASALADLLVSELGSQVALDECINRGRSGAFSRAIAPKRILHVIAGNTAQAGLQSLIRGLILGSHNLCKLPSSGLPRLEEWISGLPLQLAERIQTSRNLPGDWLETADAVIVFGTDETVELLRQKTSANQIFAGYGNKWSGAIVFEDPAFESVPLLARDVCLYDQMGCLSPQIVFVHDCVDPRLYAAKLNAAIESEPRDQTTANLSLEDRQTIRKWHDMYRWKAAVHDSVAFWLHVAFDGTPAAPQLTCLHRHVLILPFSRSPEIGSLATSLSTLGLWPFTSENIHLCTSLGASRLCPIGKMQFPLPTWHQDGFPALGRLVRWMDAG